MDIRPEGGAAAALWRACALAGLLSSFGALLVRAWIVPVALSGASAAVAAHYRKAWRRLFRAGLAAALAGSFGWMFGVSDALTDAPDGITALAAMPAVATGTVFGHVSLACVATLLLAALISGEAPGRRWIATGVAAVATLLETGHGHGAAMAGETSWPAVSLAAHLLATGAWLGGLIPLRILIGLLEPADAARAARRFSMIGFAAVGVIVVTAGFQFDQLVGGPVALIGTAYGLVILAKIALFAGLLGFAAINRYRLAPALTTDAGAVAARRLCRAILAEATLGLAVVAAAALLGGLPPAMHIEALWPFSWRPSLALVTEDADYRIEAIQAGLALAGAAGLTLAAILARRFRLPALLVTVVIAWFATPHLDVLVVRAYPTSYFQSPTDFAAPSILAGAALYPTLCASCHGAGGRGDGPEAGRLPVPPADLTAEHLWAHEDGELFWWLSDGIRDARGEPVMPGFGDTLSEAQRWGLIDYARALNAGALARRDGAWTRPIRAPALSASRGGKEMISTAGRFARIVFGASARVTADALTLLVPPPGARTSGDAWVVSDPSARDVFAILTGLAPTELDGAEVIIDDQGWLRLLRRSNDGEDWDDPKTLAGRLAELRAHPLAPPPPMTMNMAM